MKQILIFDRDSDALVEIVLQVIINTGSFTPVMPKLGLKLLRTRMQCLLLQYRTLYIG